MQHQSRIKAALAVLILSLAGGAMGAAGFDRLKDWVKIGQGTASDKLLEFDAGAGASNGKVTGTSAGSLVLAAGGATRQTIATASITATVPHLAAAGSISAPSYSYSGDPNSGLYSSAADEISLALGGAQSSAFGTTSTLLPNGSATTASPGFLSDPNTGMYRVGADDLGFTAGGTLRLDISTTAITSTLPNRTANGTNAAPAWSFSGDTDNGLFLASTNLIGVAAGGVQSLSIGATGLYSVLGDATSPPYSFGGDTNTGMYSPGADLVSWSIGGTQSLALTGDGIKGLPGSAANPAFSFISDDDTGVYRVNPNQLGFSVAGTREGFFTAGGLVVGSGSTSADKFSAKVFTGTLAASASTTLTNPGTLMLGVFGVTSLNGSANLNRTIVGTVGVSASGQNAFAGGSNPDIILNNEDNDDSNLYHVIMFYQ